MGRGGGLPPARHERGGGGDRSSGVRQGRSGADRWAPTIAWGSIGRGGWPLMGGPRPQ
jgi:hypothetical protein